MVERERYLCLMMKRKICGIDVIELMKEKEEEEEKKQVDWESLPPFPCAFNGDLPVIRSHPIELDSKIYLVGGLKPLLKDDIECDKWVPCLRTYELELDFDVSGIRRPRFEVCDLFSTAPLQFGLFMSTVTEISGDYYFLLYDGMLPMTMDCSFWVLRSRLKEWECLLSPPPSLEAVRYLPGESRWLLFDDKLFFQTCLTDEPVDDEPVEDEPVEDEPVEDEPVEDEGMVFERLEDEQCATYKRVIFYSFNSKTNSWTLIEEENDFMNSFGYIFGGQRRFLTPCITVSSVPGLSNHFMFLSSFEHHYCLFFIFFICSIKIFRKDSIKISRFRSYNFFPLKKLYIFTDKRNIIGISDINCRLDLSCSYIEDVDRFYGGHITQPMMIHALLVNQKGLRVQQPIMECFNGIQPTFIRVRPLLFELGNSEICAMLFGFAREHDGGKSPILCISAFSLTMKDALHIDNEAPPKEQSFLTVKVLSKRVYSMKRYLNCTMKDSPNRLEGFFFSPQTKKVDKEISKKRKELPQ